VFAEPAASVVPNDRLCGVPRFKRKRIVPLIVLTLRLCLSVVFFIAGMAKLLAGLESTRKSLTDFGVPKLLVGPGAVVLPAVEISIALLLFPPFSAQIAALSACGLRCQPSGIERPDLASASGTTTGMNPIPLLSRMPPRAIFSRLQRPTESQAKEIVMARITPLRPLAAASRIVAIHW